MTIKCANIHIIEISEDKKRKRQKKNLFDEIKAETFSNLEKEMYFQVQEAQNTEQKNLKRPTTKYIIIKIRKVKHKEQARNNWLCTRGLP